MKKTVLVIALTMVAASILFGMTGVYRVMVSSGQASSPAQANENSAG